MENRRIDPLRVAVVIPAFRAEHTITRVISGIPSWVDAIYVVDDASPDETSSKVGTDPRVRLLVHDTNRGVGGAMVTGYQRALEDGMDICVKMDADDQMDPSYISALIAPLIERRADYAKGNRFHDFDALRNMPTVRKVGNAGMSFLVKAASGQWHLFDPTNGYTAIHRTALEAIDLGRLHPRYFFESSMLIQLRRVEAAIEDVPMPARYGDEESSLSVGRSLLHFPGLLVRHGMRRLIWQYFVVDFNAVSLFLIAGLFLTAFGGVFGAYQWLVSYLRGVTASTGTVMLAVLPFILGFQLLLQALVLDIQSVPRVALQLRRPRVTQPPGDLTAAPALSLAAEVGRHDRRGD